jgi:hypothetical protein
MVTHALVDRGFGEGWVPMTREEYKAFLRAKSPEVIRMCQIPTHSEKALDEYVEDYFTFWGIKETDR